MSVATGPNAVNNPSSPVSAMVSGRSIGRSMEELVAPPHGRRTWRSREADELSDCSKIAATVKAIATVTAKVKRAIHMSDLPSGFLGHGGYRAMCGWVHEIDDTRRRPCG